jgi:hypothetical protein
MVSVTSSNFDDLIRGVSFDTNHTTVVDRNEQKRLREIWLARTDSTPYDDIKWDRINEKMATVYKTVPFSNVNALSEPHTTRQMEGRHHVKINSRPFEVGGLRVAYHCRLRINGVGEWQHYIAKMFMKPNARTKENYLAQLEENSIAKFLTEKWRRDGHGRNNINITCLDSKAIRVNTSHGDCWYNLERVVEGTWQRWTDNTIFVKHDTPTALLKFAKWTHEITRGYLLVADLQGGFDSDGNCNLTDPCILCPTEIGRRFGRTNFDVNQMTVYLNKINEVLASRRRRVATATRPRTPASTPTATRPRTPASTPTPTTPRTPEIMLGHPGMMLGHPGMMLGHPGMMLGHPGMMLGHPGMMLGHSTGARVVVLNGQLVVVPS